MKLRPDQEQVVERLAASYGAGNRRPVMVMPTGGGKTVVFSHLISRAQAKGSRVWLLVHRTELLEQSSATLGRLGVEHGLLQAGRPEDLSHRVQVGSIETVRRRLGRMPVPDFVVVDECHHSCSKSWKEVLEHWRQAHVLGATATPVRLDGRGLGEVFDDLVLGPTAEWLTDHGHLARARVFAPPLGFSTEGIQKRLGDFNQTQATSRLRSPKQLGDAIGHYRRLMGDRTAIAFCGSVAHAEEVAAAFTAARIRSASLDGRMDRSTRRRRLAELASGEIRVLTSCSLIGEGVDVPSVGGCILLRATASTALHLQMVGRCLRPGHGDAVVLDHVGNYERLGHHLDPREWTLDGVKRKDRDPALSIKTCPQCFSSIRSQFRTCPDCGFVWPEPEPRQALEVVDGELRELERQALRRARRSEQAAAQSYGELVTLGRQRGHRNPEGWARNVMRSRSVRAGRYHAR